VSLACSAGSGWAKEAPRSSPLHLHAELHRSGSVLSIAQWDEYLNQLHSARLDEDRGDEVITEMLFWMKDVKQIDSIADWEWNFLQPILAKS